MTTVPPTDASTSGKRPPMASQAAALRTRGSIWDLLAAGLCLVFITTVLLSVLIPVIARAG